MGRESRRGAKDPVTFVNFVSAKRMLGLGQHRELKTLENIQLVDICLQQCSRFGNYFMTAYSLPTYCSCASLLFAQK